MPRVAVNRSNPATRLASVAYAVARRQAASNASVVEVVVSAAVDAVAAEIGTSLAAIDTAIDTVNTTLAEHEGRLNALEP